MSRRERLEQLAELALDLDLALIMTAVVDPAWCPVGKDDERYSLFKAPRAKAWEKTMPTTRERNAYRGEISTLGETHNFLVNLRGSRLFGVEVDGSDDLARWRELRQELQLPEPSLVVQSGGGPDHLHLYYRLGVENPAKVSMRFEGGTIKMATNNAFVVPPSIHPSGSEYLWLALPGSREQLAELGDQQLQALLERGAAVARETRAQIQEGALIEDGNRADALFRHAVDLVRWGHSEDEIVTRLDEWQQGRFRNPHALAEVRRQVQGAFAWQQTGGAKNLDEFAEVDTSAFRPQVEEEDGRISFGGLTLTPASQITMRATPWLIKHLVVGDTLTLLAGNGGLGKSTYSLMLAAQVTRGETHLKQPGDVIVVSSEDSIEHAVIPRLRAADADFDRSLVLSADELGGSVTFPSNLGPFEQVIRARPETRLVIIDPIVASLDMQIDSHKDQHMRIVLGQLHAFAQELDLAILMIAHLNKNEQAEASARVMGSRALYNAARSVIYFVNDPDKEDESEGYRIAYQRKENYATLGHPQRYHVESVTTGTDPKTGEPIEVPRTVFVDEAWEFDREDLLSPRKKSQGRLEEAKEFLRTRLAGGAEVPVSELLEAAAAGKITRSTLYNASEELGVIRTRGHGSTWRLP